MSAAGASILSCGVVIVRRAGDGWVTLMLRAYRNWDFPKGLCEPGETPMAAAIREVAEETGIRDLVFAWGAVHFDTGPYGRGKTARYFLAETHDTAVTLGILPGATRPEHHEYRWVDFDEAHDLAAPRVRTVVRWARQILDTQKSR
ncbi:MAG TPA: NUDIX domain-containing protein [Woeseiaceae bacterium]|jgi:8-oxo-dGTP pyrophosphatase MutT (NUDIX family)|nr:NUDIX domain-containing protein [Woeseiaceae bacterium]